jgi:hypothetical protein
MNLLQHFRSLTEQSDHLYPNEKKSIIDELNQIQVHTGYYPSSRLTNRVSLPLQSTYLHYVQYLAALPYDDDISSYLIEPIYFPSNHTLYLPYGFLSRSKQSLEYHVIKLVFRIIRQQLSSNPYHVECYLHSSDHHADDWYNTSKLSSTDEQLVYIFLRSRFISDEKILLDEYLWPFMSANLLMKRFLIDYTANHYCRTRTGVDLWMNNTYLLDDTHLIFNCQQASSIKQSKCTIVWMNMQFVDVHTHTYML